MTEAEGVHPNPVPGLYESVVTDRLSGALAFVPPESVGLEGLDPGDGATEVVELHTTWDEDPDLDKPTTEENA